MVVEKQTNQQAAGSQQAAEALYREAIQKIKPILRDASRGMGTSMYLAIVELQKSYPTLRTPELEGLLQQAIKDS